MFKYNLKLLFKICFIFQYIYVNSSHLITIIIINNNKYLNHYQLSIN